MSKLVVFFSAEARKTAKVASDLAEKIGADIFEIEPVIPYTKADLKYINPFARCNREKLGKKDVPITDKVSNWDSYDTVYLGFPIWYYSAPNIINTFCKDYDWSGKKVYIFVTSGSSGLGKTKQRLKPFMKGADIIDAKRVVSIEELTNWE